jgi:hypothetical protein
MLGEGAAADRYPVFAGPSQHVQGNARIKLFSYAPLPSLPNSEKLLAVEAESRLVKPELGRAEQEEASQRMFKRGTSAQDVR